ncbi:MAG: Na+/H+ antiporter subunit E [Candidatus Methylomirabilales bacterium]
MEKPTPVPLIALLAVIWCFVRGTVDVANILMGLIMGTGIFLLFRPFFPWRSSPLRLLRKIPASLRYARHFLYELGKANLQVAYLALHPKMPIRPGIIAFRTRHRSPLGTTVLANSITLTPGTLTMDVTPDGQTLYIHTLDIGDPEEVREGIRRGLEDYTLEVAE